jgi:hypothetical protein
MQRIALTSAEITAATTADTPPANVMTDAEMAVNFVTEAVQFLGEGREELAQQLGFSNSSDLSLWLAQNAGIAAVAAKNMGQGMHQDDIRAEVRDEVSEKLNIWIDNLRRVFAAIASSRQAVIHTIESGPGAVVMNGTGADAAAFVHAYRERFITTTVPVDQMTLLNEVDHFMRGRDG